MPANLPPQYYETERRYREAKTHQEKLTILQEMLAIMPKHKGTEKLQADVKSRISKLKKLMAQGKKAGPRHANIFSIERSGAGQAILIGPPNAGKSQIISVLTNASPEVAPYPFSTQKPAPAMMPFEDIQIQLVDTSPITEQYLEPWLVGLVRATDLVLLTVDLLSDSPIEETEVVNSRLYDSKVELVREARDPPYHDGYVEKSTIMVANKNEGAVASGNLAELRESFSDTFPIVAISADQLHGLDELKLTIYSSLKIARVYTKEPGKPADQRDPVVIHKGSTVQDVAESIHKDFAQNLKYARIWGKGTYDGQRVERGHVVADGDILEFHI